MGGTAWDTVRSSERSLAEAISEHQPVLWVDPPASVVRARRQGLPSRSIVEEVGPRTLRLRPVTVPGVYRPGLSHVATRQCQRAIRRTLRSLNARADAVVVAGFIDLLDSVPGAVKVLYATDDWTAGASLMGLETSSVQRAEERQLRKADLVLAVSEPLQLRWTTDVHVPVLFPNGANVGYFAELAEHEPAPDVHLPRPIAGVVGQISARIDLRMLSAVADTGLSLLIVGPVQERQGANLEGLEALARRDNVLLAGERPFESLPGYYRWMSVGLTPYQDTAFNRASFPLKTLEYLAAGLPVVTSDLPADRLLGSDLIVSSSDPQRFAELAYAAAHAAPDPALVEARRALATQHSWDTRAEHLLDLIREIRT